MKQNETTETVVITDSNRTNITEKTKTTDKNKTTTRTTKKTEKRILQL